MTGGSGKAEKLQNMLMELRGENSNLQQRLFQLQRLEDNIDVSDRK
jgi:hypothetical protein